ncbi:MAG: hypothetical protein FJY81_01560 [Candidatus Aminicenantes bacterium]|nr:hypothetical protein [Candidatus Aminicenantes bacterium]
MSCVRIDEIHAYLEDDLLPGRRADIESHLASCPKCREAVEERRRLGEASTSLADLELPADFSSRVMARILRRGSSLPVWLTASIAGLASLGLLCFLIILSGGKTAFTLVAGFHHFFLAYFKNATVVLAKVMILLASAGRILQTLARVLAKCLSLLTALISPEVQALIVALTVAFFISLYFGVRKKLLPGEKT